MTGEECVLPFSYDGDLYYGCTTKDFGNIPWCATSVDSYLNVVDWNYCKSSSSDSSYTGSGYNTAYASYGSNAAAQTAEDEDVEYKSYECSKDMPSQTLVWLNSPGDPIGIVTRKSFTHQFYSILF